MAVRSVARSLLCLMCCYVHIAFSDQLTIPLNVSGTDQYRANPADVVFLQVINLICTQQKTAVYNVNKTQYDSCSHPSVDDYQNIHIGDCGEKILIVVAENVLRTAVNYKAGETFYYAVYSISTLGDVVNSEPCEGGVKFKLHVVDPTMQTRTSSLITSVMAPASTILSSSDTPAPTIVETQIWNLTSSINRALSTQAILSAPVTTLLQSTETLDSLRTPITKPITSGIGEATSDEIVLPVYAIGTIVGGLAVLFVIVIVSVIMTMVCRRKKQVTIYNITKAKEHFGNCELVPERKRPVPYATNRLSYEFMDDRVDQLGGVSTFQGEPLQREHHEQHRIDLCSIAGQAAYL